MLNQYHAERHERDGFHHNPSDGSNVVVGRDGKLWPYTVDAAIWATEFCKRNTAADWGTMLGWFANAIEVKQDKELDFCICTLRQISVLCDGDASEGPRIATRALEAQGRL